MGKVFRFNKDVDTDQIIASQYLLYPTVDEMKAHTFESLDANFASDVKPGDYVVADSNFGCGSSREHAAMTLKGIEVGAILAESFGRIFYRNAINLGIPAITCKGIHALVKRGDTVRIDFTTGEIVNETTGARAKAEPMNDYMMGILQNGGIKPMIRKMQEEKNKQGK